MLLLFCAILKFLYFQAADVSRSFIVQVHLEDDSIQVLEPPQRNSGHKGGVFLNRGKIESHDGSKVVQPQDIHIGAVVPIYGHRFVIHDADEFTLRHMEENSRHWTHSDIPLVTEKLMAKREVVIRVILTSPGLTNKIVNPAEVHELFERAGLTMARQEIVTLIRLLDPRKSGKIKLTKLLKYLMTQDDN
jgi:hypothetical protein